jgi:hypothetical protein
MQFEGECWKYANFHQVICLKLPEQLQFVMTKVVLITKARNKDLFLNPQIRFQTLHRFYKSCVREFKKRNRKTTSSTPNMWLINYALKGP